MSSSALLTTFVRRQPRPTPVFDAYWSFAVERQRVFHARATGAKPPWTSDPIISTHRFTNAYRAADRVSQFLINNVIPGSAASGKDVLFRTLLFKIFNRIHTWRALESAFGDIHVDSFDARVYADVLADVRRLGGQIYSAAYIMPMPGELGAKAKHEAHLSLIARLASDGTLERLCEASSLQRVYEVLLGVPSFGPFLAFQFAIDANYSSVVNHSEMEFVVAGPGARSGIDKCFFDLDGMCYEDVIRFTCERAGLEFANRDLVFDDLWGRPLQLVDCQNLYCEVGKYARAAFPQFLTARDRTRIKQKYRPDTEPLSYAFPPKWRLSVAGTGIDPLDNARSCSLAANTR